MTTARLAAVIAVASIVAVVFAARHARRASAAPCDETAPVCGRDGQVHASECAARAAGVALDVAGGCRSLVPGWASCGARYCDARTSYCEIYLSDAPELPTGHACRPLPAACRPPEGAGARCECLEPMLAGHPAFCGRLVTGGLPALHVTFQGVKEPRR